MKPSIGQRVRIAGGAFAGSVGVVVEQKLRTKVRIESAPVRANGRAVRLGKRSEVWVDTIRLSPCHERVAS